MWRGAPLAVLLVLIEGLGGLGCPDSDASQGCTPIILQLRAYIETDLHSVAAHGILGGRNECSALRPHQGLCWTLRPRKNAAARHPSDFLLIDIYSDDAKISGLTSVRSWVAAAASKMVWARNASICTLDDVPVWAKGSVWVDVRRSAPWQHSVVELAGPGASVCVTSSPFRWSTLLRRVSSDRFYSGGVQRNVQRKVRPDGLARTPISVRFVAAGAGSSRVHAQLPGVPKPQLRHRRDGPNANSRRGRLPATFGHPRSALLRLLQQPGGGGGSDGASAEGSTAASEPEPLAVADAYGVPLGLWARGITGAGVHVAVLDTGLPAGHPHFRAGAVVERINWTSDRRARPPQQGQGQGGAEMGAEDAGAQRRLLGGASQPAAPHLRDSALPPQRQQPQPQQQQQQQAPTAGAEAAGAGSRGGWGPALVGMARAAWAKVAGAGGVMRSSSGTPLPAAAAAPPPPAALTNDAAGDDTIGHGTFVASVIAGYSDEFAAISAGARGGGDAPPLPGPHATGAAHTHCGNGGLAPGASLHVYRVFTTVQTSYTSWFLDALNHAMAVRVDVINLSIGGPDHTDEPFADKVTEAVAAGATFVSAIGNDGPLGGTLNSPGDMPAVLGVGGVTASGDGSPPRVAAFSSRGPTLWAGEGGAGRAKPDVVAHASSLSGSTLDGGCRAMSGTSVAAPVVSGAVALVVSGVHAAVDAAAGAAGVRAGEGAEAAALLANPAAVRQALTLTAHRLLPGEGAAAAAGGGGPFAARLAASHAWRGLSPSDQGAGHIDVVAAADWLREGLLRRLAGGSGSGGDACLAAAAGLPVEGAVSAFPSAVAFEAAACPRAWPQCSQPLWPGGRAAGAAPGIANLTIINSVGVASTVVAYAWRPGAGGSRLQVRVTPQSPLAPWAGWLGVEVEAVGEAAAAAAAAEGGAAWDDPASCDHAEGVLEVTVATPVDPARRRWLRALAGGAAAGLPPTLQGCDNAWAPGSSGAVILSTLRIPVSADIARTPPPRSRRILWSMRHSLAYPLAYAPRDELYAGSSGGGSSGGGDVLDWHGDSPYTNFRGAYEQLRALGYAVTLGGGDWSAGGPYDLRAFGVLWLADAERAPTASEAEAIGAAVDAGTGLAVFADWWDATLLRHSEFADDNTRGSWRPATGGADVPGLNSLLARWGVALGQRVYAGVLARGEGSGDAPQRLGAAGDTEPPPEPRSARFASGVAVVHVPATGSYVYWASLRDQSGPARTALLAQVATAAAAAAGATRATAEARVPLQQQQQQQPRRRASSSSAAAASYAMVPILALVDPLPASPGGRVAVFGDSSCLDDALPVPAAPAAANGFRGPCWWVADAVLGWLDGGPPPPAEDLFGAAHAPRTRAEAAASLSPQQQGAPAEAVVTGQGTPLWWPDPLAEPPPLPPQAAAAAAAAPAAAAVATAGVPKEWGSGQGAGAVDSPPPPAAAPALCPF